MRKAEREIGKNIPEEMKGLDTEDLGSVETDETRDAGKRANDGPPKGDEEG